MSIRLLTDTTYLQVFQKEYPRYERKMYFPSQNASEVESWIRLHPEGFKEIYSGRFVNSIYFDSLDMKCYFDAINVLNERYKVRIRWYGELFGKIEKPVLELKWKHGQLVKKDTYDLMSFDFYKNSS